MTRGPGPIIQRIDNPQNTLDTGLWLFCGLVVLFVWRSVFWWKCCGGFNRMLNYVTLLIVLVFTINVYDCYVFFESMTGPSSIPWDQQPGWLKVIVYMAPPVVWVGFCLGCHQVYTHIVCIREDAAVLRHDRAIQILILPMVYSTMCLSCVTKCYAYIRSDDNAFTSHMLPLAVARAETCLWIGDLYESWALYQFGVLSLEVMESSLIKQSQSREPEERAAANALIVAHKAVTKLAWLGILSFVVVSVADSAVALLYLTFGVGMPNLVHKFNSAEDQFNAAGFLASCAAIANVYIVENTFHHFLEEFYPFLKFLTVKILVTFAYGQLYFFICLQSVYGIAGDGAQAVIRKIPLLGDLCQFNQAQFYLFYASLLVVECLFIAIIHMFAWKSAEIWYDDDDQEGSKAELDGPLEKKALLPGEALLYGTSSA